MAAFDDFVPPQQGAFSGFTPPSADDIMLQHMASWLPGAAYLHNLTRVGEAGVTSGLSNRLDQAVSNLGSYLGLSQPTTIEQQAAQTEKARQAVGPVAATAAEVAGTLANPLAKVGGPGLGGALAQGGTMGLAQGVGSSDDPSQWALQGVLGAGAGAVAHGVGTVAGRIFGKAPQPPTVGTPQSSTGPATGMYAQKTREYAPLDGIYFDTPTVRNALDQAHSTISATRDPQGLGADLGIPTDVNTLVKNVYNQPVATGRNLQVTSRELRGSGDWTGHRYADALDNVMQNAQPISGGQVGDAWDAKTAGDLTSGRINDLERLGDQPTSAAVKQTQQFYTPGSPEYESLNTLQKAMQPPFNWWHVRHMAAPLVGAALGGAEGFFNPAEKQNPWVTGATSALEGAALFSGLPMAQSALGKARAANALNAARYAIGTGQAIPKSNTAQALRTLMLGPATGGVF